MRAQSRARVHQLVGHLEQSVELPRSHARQLTRRRVGYPGPMEAYDVVIAGGGPGRAGDGSAAGRGRPGRAGLRAQRRDRPAGADVRAARGRTTCARWACPTGCGTRSRACPSASQHSELHDRLGRTGRLLAGRDRDLAVPGGARRRGRRDDRERDAGAAGADGSAHAPARRRVAAGALPAGGRRDRHQRAARATIARARGLPAGRGRDTSRSCRRRRSVRTRR